MGSSDTEGAVVDCSVGSIVWVRRRNGSWWPGKILGPEELPASHVASPRSGTPVKLLGREDASVDWYNLEKSKRVKSFRCGEFYDFIERAEAAQRMPPKKREKYARREDAIFHALELEKQSMEQKYGKLESSSWPRSEISPDAVACSDYLGNDGGNENNDIPNHPSGWLDPSLFMKNEIDQQLSVLISRDGNQLSGEDSAGMLPRIRGLQDIDLHTVSSMGEEHFGSTHRTKRSKYSHVQNDPMDSANDSRIPSSPLEIEVSKFEESTYPADIGDDQVSGSTEDTETDSSESDSVESDSDEEITAPSDGSASVEMHSKYPRRIELHEDHRSISSIDDGDGLTHTNGLLHPSRVATGTEVSKWQLKGKSKSRNLVNKAPDNLDSEFYSGYMNIRIPSRSSSVNKSDLIAKNTQNPRYLSGVSHNRNEITDLEAWSWNSHSASRGYNSQEYVDPFFVGRLMLLDVDLKVDANNYRRNVSMISLISKLNGHAIVGHPVLVEPLEPGSAENLLSCADCLSSETAECAGLPSVWRTGRRTANFRVPRPFSALLLNGDSRKKVQSVNREAQHQVLADHGNVKHKAVRKSMKISASYNLKIRSLSSIPAEDRHQNDAITINAVYKDKDKVMIKTGNVPTVVACIPVNLVFSRLHEDLVGRHQHQHQ